MNQNTTFSFSYDSDKIATQIPFAIVAKKIGLEPALFLQKIKYWVLRCGRKITNCAGGWIYNSLEAWKKQFPYLSEYKIRKSIKLLEKLGIIISKKVNSKKWNHTKWYTIDWKKYNLLLKSLLDTQFDKKKPPKNKAHPPDVSKDFATSSQLKKSSDRSDEIQQIINIHKTNYTKRKISLSKSLSHLSNSYQVTYTKSEKETKKEREKLKNVVKSSPVTTPQQEPNQQHKPQNEDIAAKLVESWNGIFKNSESPIKAYSNKRLASKLVKLYEEDFNNNLEEWKAYVRRIASNEFLTGKKKGGFKAPFPWFLRKDTVNTILNDGYGTSDKTEHLIQDTIPQEMTKIWYSSISPQEDLPKLNKARIKKLAKVFQCHFESNMDKWKNFVSLVANCKFLTGGVTNFKASIWWAIRENILLKIQEGAYHSKDEWGAVTAKSKKKLSLQELEGNKDIDPRLKRLFLHAIKIFGEATYISWISKLSMSSFQDGVLKLKVGSSFVKEYMEMHYERKLLSIAGNYFDGVKKIRFAVSQS